MMLVGALALAILGFNQCFVQSLENSQEITRNKKQFSLFTVVTFPNNQCDVTSTSSGVSKGTCLSSSECTSKSGTVNGNCASGFGVCCTFLLSTCGSTVTQNCSYIQNPGYSSAYTTTGSCSYTVTPINSGICQIRLDFDTFSLGIGTKGTCSDSFKITCPTNTNVLPNLCGKLTGQHIYFESGASTTSSTLAFTIAGTTSTWNMKVSQISCTATYKAPNDCDQYLTGQSGTVQSYGWQSGQQITGTIFTTCIRRERGYCANAYYVVSGETIDTYQTDNFAGTLLGSTDNPDNSWDSSLEGYLMISGTRSDLASSALAGDYLNSAITDGAFTINTPVYSYGPRFLLTHVVNTIAINTGDTGFYLQYTQLPCGVLEF